MIPCMVSLALVRPTYTVNENGTNAVITITRTNGSLGQVSAVGNERRGAAPPFRVPTNDYITRPATWFIFGSGITNKTNQRADRG